MIIFKLLLFIIVTVVISSPAMAKNDEKKVSQIPDGKYFFYAPNYKCKKTGSALPVPAYSDSYSMQGGVFCRTGDGCSAAKTQCVKSVPKNVKFAPDFQSFTTDDGKVFRKQNDEYPESCWMPACAYPDEICKFGESAPLDEKGCPMGCGTILCKPNLAKNCPELNCAAPPQR